MSPSRNSSFGESLVWAPIWKMSKSSEEYFRPTRGLPISSSIISSLMRLHSHSWLPEVRTWTVSGEVSYMMSCMASMQWGQSASS